MSTLVVVDLAWQSFFLDGLVDPVTVFGHDVPIVERVGHEQGGLHVVELMDVVAAFPKLVVVAGRSIEFLEHTFVPHIAVACLAVCVVA